MEALLGFEVTAISCGSCHVVALTNDSDVFSWGRSDNGMKCFLPMQRCASVILNMALCLSVRLSVTNQYCVETAEKIELVLA